MKYLFFLLVFPAFAQSLTEPQVSGWIIASSLGSSRPSDLHTPSPEFQHDHDKTAFDLTIGYQFSNRSFAEFSYFNLGSTRSDFEQENGTLLRNTVFQKENEGIALNYRDEVRLFRNLHGFLMAGLVGIHSKVETVDRLEFKLNRPYVVEESTSEDSWMIDAQWGVGLSFEIKPQHNLFLKYEDKIDSQSEENALLNQRFQTLQIGWQWRFHSNE